MKQGPRLMLAVVAPMLLGAAAPPPPPCPDPAALGTSREIEVGGAAPLGLKTYPRTLDLQDHEVVLTFDDGPSPLSTPRILDALERACVRATFFLVGRAAAHAPALVRREIAAGHTLGHHSFSHPAVTLRGLPGEAAMADIERGMDADDTAAYGTYDGHPRVPFFRFPGFADTPDLLSRLGARSVAVFGADLWASDWVPMTAQAELHLLMGRLDRAGRGIILLHDTKAQTAQMLPLFLDALKEGGYKVVHMVPGRGPAPIRLAPAGWTSETERTIAHLRPGIRHASALPTAQPGPPQP